MRHPGATDCLSIREAGRVPRIACQDQSLAVCCSSPPTGERKNVGDVQIGHIYNMDCVEGMQLLPEECVDLVITDPPFAIDFKAKQTDSDRR